LAASNDKPAGMTKVNAQQKAATTHDAAMRIIDAEVAAREKKTERLRRLRMEREATEPVAEAAPKRRKSKSQ
jgi:hypothetical protein